jgi:hypothetical protein
MVWTALALGAALPCFADWKEEIGYDRLRARLGTAMPAGERVSVAQVELSIDIEGRYLPDLQDGRFAGKRISGRSGDFAF